MKKTFFTSLVLGILILIFGPAEWASAHTNKKVSLDMEIRPVANCPPENEIGMECVRYTPKRGDNLSRLARRYSSQEQKLTVRTILDLNPQLVHRPNLIRAGMDKIVLPFVLKKDWEQAKKLSMVRVEEKEKNTKLQELADQLNHRLTIFFIWGAVMSLAFIATLIFAIYGLCQKAPTGETTSR